MCALSDDWKKKVHAENAAAALTGTPGNPDRLHLSLDRCAASKIQIRYACQPDQIWTSEISEITQQHRKHFVFLRQTAKDSYLRKRKLQIRFFLQKASIYSFLCCLGRFRDTIGGINGSIPAGISDSLHVLQIIGVHRRCPWCLYWWHLSQPQARRIHRRQLVKMIDTCKSGTLTSWEGAKWKHTARWEDSYSRFR